MTDFLSDAGLASGAALVPDAGLASGAALVPDPGVAPPLAAAPGLADLVGLDREELKQIVTAVAGDRAGAMRANQLWHWLYHQGATSFETMTTLSKDLRAKLAEVARVSRPEVVRALVSSDGTRK